MPMCATSNREIVCIPMRLTLSMLQPLGLTHICILRTYVYVDKKPTWPTHTSPFGSRRQPECIYGCHFLSYWALTLFSSFFFFALAAGRTARKTATSSRIAGFSLAFLNSNRRLATSFLYPLFSLSHCIKFLSVFDYFLKCCCCTVGPSLLLQLLLAMLVRQQQQQQPLQLLLPI